MIRKVYSEARNNDIIIELDNQRLLSLSPRLALRVQENYCHKLENIESASIFNIPKEEVTEEIMAGKGGFSEIYDIIGSNGNYYLLFMDKNIKSDVTIAPGELKIILNCFKKEQPKGVPWDDGNF